MKFATKSIWHYPPHLRHVATLPREIEKNSNILQMWKKTQTNCILITSNFVIHPQILLFLVFKIASLSRYWFQIKLSMSLYCCADCGCSVFDFALFISQNVAGYSSLFVVYLALWVDLCSVYNITVRYDWLNKQWHIWVFWWILLLSWYCLSRLTWP